MPHRLVSILQIQSLLAQAEVLQLSDRARQRLQWFLHYLQHGQSVSSTCAHFGISRATFQRWLERFDPHDPQTLEERSHHPRTLRQSAVPEDVVALIAEYRRKHPQMGKERIAQLLKQDHQVTLSASTVGRVIERECLYFSTTPHHWKKSVDRERAQASRLPEAEPVPIATVQAPAVTAASAQAAEDQSRIPAPALAPAACANCFLCRLRQMRWHWLKRGAFITSVFLNLLVLLLLLAGFLGQPEADSVHASANQSRAPAAFASSSPAPPDDAR